MGIVQDEQRAQVLRERGWKTVGDELEAGEIDLAEVAQRVHDDPITLGRVRSWMSSDHALAGPPEPATDAEHEMAASDGLGAARWNSPGEKTIGEMQGEAEYDPMGDSEIDSLIAYKDALEDRLMQMIDGPGIALRQIRALASEDLDLDGCVDPAERVAARLERIANIAGAGEPDEDYRPAMIDTMD